MGEIRFVHVGKGHVVNASRVLTILQPKTHTSIRLKTEAEKNGKLVDCSKGKTIRSLIQMDDGLVLQATLGYETLMNRLNGKAPAGSKEEDGDD